MIRTCVSNSSGCFRPHSITWRTCFHHAEGVSGEGWRGRILQAADRRGSVQDHPGGRNQRDRSGALRWLLRCQPKGQAGNWQDQIHEVPDSATEMADLMGGRADWIWKFNPDQFNAVGRMPNLQAVRAESMRIEYLAWMRAGRTGAEIRMTKEKVRQAIFYAIDRATMAEQLCRAVRGRWMRRATRRSSVAIRLPRCTIRMIPRRRSNCCAEAGYPNGFDTELVSYLLPQWAGAVQDYLGGRHQCHVTHLQVGPAVQRRHRRANAAEFRQLGQLLDQRRVGDPAVFLYFRRQRLCA